jgi:flagellar protein FlbD
VSDRRRASSDEYEIAVIQLTRLRHGESFLVNPDLFERIDGHVDTVVRLTNGTEYVVSESPAEILERIVAFRSHILACGFAMQAEGVAATHRVNRPELVPGEPILTVPDIDVSDSGVSGSVVGDHAAEADAR